MEHTHIVNASELERYADTRESEAVIPELIWMLVNEVPDLTSCRIPYGDSVNQSGLDGLVEANSGFKQFVPSGTVVLCDWRRIRSHADVSGCVRIHRS